MITYYSIVNAKDAIEANGGTFSIGDVFTNTTFRCAQFFTGLELLHLLTPFFFFFRGRNIVISLLSTYALYLISSLIFFDPAHMVTSFFQYLLFSPAMTNCIMVYASALWCLGRAPAARCSGHLVGPPASGTSESLPRRPRIADYALLTPWTYPQLRLQ